MQCCQLTRDEQPESFATASRFSHCISTTSGNMIVAHLLHHSSPDPTSAVDDGPTHGTAAALWLQLHQHHATYGTNTNGIFRKLHNESSDQSKISVNLCFRIKLDIPKDINISKQGPSSNRFLNRFSNLGY